MKHLLTALSLVFLTSTLSSQVSHAVIDTTNIEEGGYIADSECDCSLRPSKNMMNVDVRGTDEGVVDSGWAKRTGWAEPGESFAKRNYIYFSSNVKSPQGKGYRCKVKIKQGAMYSSDSRALKLVSSDSRKGQKLDVVEIDFTLLLKGSSIWADFYVPHLTLKDQSTGESNLMVVGVEDSAGHPQCVFIHNGKKYYDQISQEGSTQSFGTANDAFLREKAVR